MVRLFSKSKSLFWDYWIGSIITGPKNFLNNPTKKGLGNTTVGHLFGPVEYGSDPFHRAKEMDIVIISNFKSLFTLLFPFIMKKDRADH